MPKLTTTPTFESIETASLTAVTGGCGGKKHRRCCCPQPQAAPQPMGGTSVDVSVGYGQQAAQPAQPGGGVQASAQVSA